MGRTLLLGGAPPPADRRAPATGALPAAARAARCGRAAGAGARREPQAPRSQQQGAAVAASPPEKKRTKKAVAPPPPPPPDAPAAAPRAASVSVWPARGGGGGRRVQVMQDAARDGGHRVYIHLAAAAGGGGGGGDAPAGPPPELHWGMYRSDPGVWQHPAAAVPPGSRPDAARGAMRTPLAPVPGGGGWAASLAVPATLAPITLAFVFALPSSSDAGGGEDDGPEWVSPLPGGCFTVPLGMGRGAPAPLGASAAGARAGAPPAELNFAVRAPAARAVSLVLVRPPRDAAAADAGDASPSSSPPHWGVVEVSLDEWSHRTGDVWHVSLPAPRGLAGLAYGWRVDGDVSWESGGRVQPDAALLDPHATALLYVPVSDAAPPPPLPLPRVEAPGGGAFWALASLAPLAAPRAPAPQPLRAPAEGARALEVDAAVFGRGRGYAGVAERAGEVAALGATAVVLAPAYACGRPPGGPPGARAAVAFLAPDPALSSDPTNPAAAGDEFAAMVDALHARGIEVLLAFDFGATAEGGDAAPATLSLRGLDYAGYYRPGGGGVFNPGHPAGAALAGAALRRWAADFGADGFVLLDAENLCQDRDGGVLDAPPAAEALSSDPQLAGLKLVAAPGDAALLPRGGARGFPHWGRWMARVDGFGADVGAWLAGGAPGGLAAVAARLAGSAALLDADWASGLPGCLAAGRRPAMGLAPPLPRRGGTLGEAADAVVGRAAAAAAAAGGPDAALPARAAVGKTLVAAALLGAGAPLLPAEVGDGSWLGVEGARFAGAVARLRRRGGHLLAPPRFDSPRALRWHAAGGGEPAWDDADAPFLAFSVEGPDGDAVYVAINAGGAGVHAAPPPPPPGAGPWRRAVDTAAPAPDDARLGDFPPVEEAAVWVAPKALVALVAGWSS